MSTICNRLPLRAVALATVVALTQLSCGEDAAGPAGCQTGATQPCECVPGQATAGQGTQTCDASAWGSCEGCPTTKPAGQQCTPGRVEAGCCSDGVSGQRTCNPSGLDWSDCAGCPSGAQICQPDASEPCTCAGGNNGSKTCRGDGTAWLPCACQPGPPTPCGDNLTCDSDTHVCVVETAFSFGYACMPLPKACTEDRSCACVGALVCFGLYDTCKAADQANTVYCDCSECSDK